MIASSNPSLDAYDGTPDFDGASGDTSPYNKSQMFGGTINTPELLAFFEGNGTLSLPISIDVVSSAGGPGNVIYSFTSQAGVDLEVNYIPEPATFAILGLGAMAVVIRRTK